MNPTVPPAYLHGDVTSTINAAAIAVHRALGPGFLESIYEEALCVELDRRSVVYQRQLPVRVRYEGVLALVNSRRAERSTKLSWNP